MTLIINLLHKDFSLLAGDRLANANGPTTITLPGLTINMPNGGKVEGVFQKLVRNANHTAAVGSAGTIAHHTFVDSFKKAASPDDALKAVRDAAHNFFEFEQRDELLDCKDLMINEAAVTFFDKEKAAFWTFIVKYTRFESHYFPYARRKNTTACLFSVGSGNSTLAEKITQHEIDEFICSIRDVWDEAQLARWLDDVFRTVHENNETVGATYDALIATRDNPIFRLLTR